MTSTEISHYNFQAWLQNKCSSQSGSITDKFISGNIHVDYDSKRKIFIIYPDKKEYPRELIERSLDTKKDLDLLVEKILELNSGRTFSGGSALF